MLAVLLVARLTCTTDSVVGDQAWLRSLAFALERSEWARDSLVVHLTGYIDPALHDHFMALVATCSKPLKEPITTAFWPLDELEVPESNDADAWLLKTTLMEKVGGFGGARFQFVFVLSQAALVCNPLVFHELHSALLQFSTLYSAGLLIEAPPGDGYRPRWNSGGQLLRIPSGDGREPPIFLRGLCLLRRFYLNLSPTTRTLLTNDSLQTYANNSSLSHIADHEFLSLDRSLDLEQKVHEWLYAI